MAGSEPRLQIPGSKIATLEQNRRTSDRKLESTEPQPVHRQALHIRHLRECCAGLATTHRYEDLSDPTGWKKRACRRCPGHEQGPATAEAGFAWPHTLPCR